MTELNLAGAGCHPSGPSLFRTNGRFLKPLDYPADSRPVSPDEAPRLMPKERSFFTARPRDAAGRWCPEVPRGEHIRYLPLRPSRRTGRSASTRCPRPPAPSRCRPPGCPLSRKPHRYRTLSAKKIVLFIICDQQVSWLPAVHPPVGDGIYPSQSGGPIPKVGSPGIPRMKADSIDIRIM